MEQRFTLALLPIGGRMKFSIIESYEYELKYPMTNKDSGENVITTIKLEPGYKWNGSNVVTDTVECLRGSAIHDRQCIYMEEFPELRTRANWRRAAVEYREICIEDGMRTLRAWIRHLAIIIYGYATIRTR